LRLPVSSLYALQIPASFFESKENRFTGHAYVSVL